MLDDIIEGKNGESDTPDAHQHFVIAEDTTNLSQTNTDLFHQFLAQLLYLSKRARLYIQLVLSFLWTRLRETGTDNYKNQARLTKYIKGTIVPPLILSINKTGNIKLYVDAAFVANKDMRIHTGIFITMGTGGVYIQCSKQNLNTKS